jgi:hypothetical protein
MTHRWIESIFFVSKNVYMSKYFWSESHNLYWSYLMTTFMCRGQAEPTSVTLLLTNPYAKWSGRQTDNSDIH